MNDIPAWIKSFQRGGFPHAQSVSEPYILADEGAENLQSQLVTARIIPKLNLSLPSMPPESAFKMPPTNQAEMTWHNPNPDQMIETLRVAMMTQSSFEPLDVRFNSCILHVLEAYQIMSQVLKERDREIQRLRLVHEESMRDIGQQILSWREKEDRYKTDIKDLEVMLATEARGLELVTMARAKSARGRSSPTGNASRFKVEDFTLPLSEGGPFGLSFAETGSLLKSESYNSNKQGQIINSRLDVPTEQSFRFNQGTERLKKLRSTKLAVDVDRKEVAPISNQLQPLAFRDKDSNLTEDFDSATCYNSGHKYRRQKDFAEKSVYNGQTPHTAGSTKPIPRKNCKENQTITKQALGEVEERGGSREGPAAHKGFARQRGFSFELGDDYESLPMKISRSRENISTTDDCSDKQDERNYEPLGTSDDTGNPLDKLVRRSQPRRSIGHLNTLTTGDPLFKNGDPQKSAVATTHDHGESYRALVVRDETEGFGAGRQTRNEAKIAAVRAIADSAKNNTPRNSKA